MRNPPNREATRWLGEADHDLEAARLLRDAGKHHLACFHAQQAAEKALKGYLYGQGEDIVTGHSIHRLCKTAARYSSEFEAHTGASVLDSYYIPPRYPNGVPSDTVPSEIYGSEQSNRAIEIAAGLLDAARSLIETHPTSRAPG